MNIYPAVDILGGKAVRLQRGDFSKSTVYFEDAVDAAKHWESLGAKYLHVVDLEGALLGEQHSLETIERIIKETSLKVQAGGGLRSEELVDRMLAIGVWRVVLGTAVIKDPVTVSLICNKYPERVVAALDVKNGTVAVEGWTEESGVSFAEVVHDLEMFGVKTVMYTDISRDGTRQGLDIDALTKVITSVFYPVIISGGVAGIEDIRNLKKIEHLGIDGVIIGSALYEKSIDLKEALSIA